MQLNSVLRNTLRTALNSPTLMSWASHVVKFGSALFLLPIILLNFSEADVALWLLFSTILGLARLADTGFGTTLVRAVSYFYSGVNKLPQSIIELKDITPLEGSSPNYDNLLSLMRSITIIYAFICVLAVVVLQFVGMPIATNVMEMSSDPSRSVYAYYVLIFSAATYLISGKWIAFIRGIDQVATISRAEALLNTLKIGLMCLMVVSGYKILAIMLVEALNSVATYLFSRRIAAKWFSNSKVLLSSRSAAISWDLVRQMWPATWRFGVVSYGSYLITYGNGIVVSQLDDPSLIASFLLTQRLVYFIRQVSQTPFYSNLPRIIQMVARSESEALKGYCVSRITFGLAFQLVSLVCLIIFGNAALSYLEIDVKLVDPWILFIMTVYMTLELHSAFHTQIYMTTNQIPFVWPVVISGTTIVTISLAVVGNFQLLGVVLVQLLIQASFLHWYPVYLTLKMLDWPLNTYAYGLVTFGTKSYE